jgi:hypothetical protein
MTIKPRLRHDDTDLAAGHGRQITPCPPAAYQPMRPDGPLSGASERRWIVNPMASISTPMIASRSASAPVAGSAEPELEELLEPLDVDPLPVEPVSDEPDPEPEPESPEPPLLEAWTTTVPCMFGCGVQM